MDCDYSEDGCDGGDPEEALTYIKSQGGLDTEESYPYVGYQGDCQFSQGNVGATDTGLVQINYGDEGDLKNAVATVVRILYSIDKNKINIENTQGPISVAIDASNDSFQYISGEEIYDEPNCDPDALDHAGTF